MNSKTKSRVLSMLNWLAEAILMLTALAFIYSAQVFHEQKLQTWANVFTTVGSAMLTLVSIHMGIRLQRADDRKAERRKDRKGETSIHRDYLQGVSDLIQQFERAEQLSQAGSQNEGDLMAYRAREKLRSLQDLYPSTANITDDYFNDKIEEAMVYVTELCDGFLDDDQTTYELSIAIKNAFNIIKDYENID